MLKLLLLLFFAVCTLTEETDSLLSVSWKEGKAKQSDDYSAEFGAKNAVDGDLTTCAISCSTCIKQNIVDELAWWQYDLGEDILVRKIIIIASTRSFEAATLENFVVIVRPTNSTDNLANPAYLCAANHRKVLPASNLTLDCGRHIKGRYVTIKRQGGRNSHLLVLCHVSIYAQVIERSTTTIKTTTTKDDNNNNNNNNNSNKDKNNNNNNNNGDNTLTTSQKTSFSASNKKNDQQNDNEKTTFGLSNGSIRGIIISCVFLFLIILLIILFFFLFRFSFKKKKPGTDGLKKNTFLSSNQTEVVRNEDALLDEFMNLPEDFMFPATTALEPNNSLKNSFINTIPYDYNRVQLPGDNDYINGSYIKGFDAKLKYICAQTPTEETLSDWWRMVDCSKIRTCVSFCPMPGGWTRAGKTLNPIDDSHYNLYSKFTFSDEQLQRVFTFFQINDMHNKNNNKKNSDNKNNTINSYNNNHNDNVNDDALEVVFSSYKVKEILNLVRQHPSNNKKNNKTNNNETKRNNRNNYNYGNNSNESTNIYKYDNDGDVTEKILVQCRAGISLSGCLIACDISLDEFESRGEVDLANNVAALRRQRANLLNTMELYRCAHQVLSEHKSLFGTDDDRVWLGTGGVQDRLKSQYEVLVRMTDAMQQSIKKPRWIQKYKKDEWYVVLKDGALQLNYVVECCKTLLLVDAPFPKFLPLEEGQETCYEDEADEDEVNGKKHGEKNGKERKMFRRIICTGIVPCGENITFYTYSIFQKESLNAPPLSPLPPLQFSSPFCYQKTFSIVHFKPSFSGLGIQANQYVMLHGLLSRDADTSTGNLGISCETTSMAFNTVAILHALDRKMFESVDDVISSCRHVGCGWNFVSMEGFLLAHEVLNRSQHGLKVKHNQ